MARTLSPVRPNAASTAALDEAIQLHLGAQLRTLYGDPDEAKVPRDLARLIERLTQAIRAYSDPVDPEFVKGIMDSVLSLRSFAISLTKRLDQAEDLVQDTILKALSKQAHFEAGTNLQAWLFTILRNTFLSQIRKSGREILDEDGNYAATMTAVPDQEDKLAMQDLNTALAKLPQEQREAILLVGAEGMAYEEAAEMLGVAVGTIKSRVNRARNKLAELMGLDSNDGIAASRLRA
jgi:RNA polymerase sigma-70 factor (ECF subfamily)